MIELIIALVVGVSVLFYGLMNGMNEEMNKIACVFVIPLIVVIIVIMANTTQKVTEIPTKK